MENNTVQPLPTTTNSTADTTTTAADKPLDPRVYIDLSYREVSHELGKSTFIENSSGHFRGVKGGPSGGKDAEGEEVEGGGSEGVEAVLLMMLMLLMLLAEVAPLVFVTYISPPLSCLKTV